MFVTVSTPPNVLVQCVLVHIDLPTNALVHAFVGILLRREGTITIPGSCRCQNLGRFWWCRWLGVFLLLLLTVDMIL